LNQTQDAATDELSQATALSKRAIGEEVGGRTGKLQSICCALMNRIPGRRLFIAGNIVLLLLGIVHLLPFIQSNFVPPGTEIERDIHRALHSLKLDMGPFHATGWHTVQLLSASYSTLVLFVAVLNLSIMGAATVAGVSRTLIIVNVVFTGILFAVTLVYQFPPPMVFTAVAEILFVSALIKQRPTPQPAD
jgi:hypothetical protein